MCGITGIVNLNKKDVDPKILKNINDEIHRRGPDDEGFFIRKNVGLGARRLSIIDLASGHQPIGNEDGSIWITFNGEIYNFPELRSLLLERGHNFKSKSDTEVVVHLYEEFGMDFLKHLNGMFAFVIFDVKKQKIIAARDRFGEKPFYYGIFNDTFIFASELKAILKHPFSKRKIDMQSLSYYLSYEYVPSPKSIFKDIYKLPPASYLILDLKTSKYKISKFWEIKFEHPKTYLCFEEYLYELDRRIYETVKSRMIADVPLGVFLSGGIDSSTIAYYMSLISPGKVKSFSIGFDDPSFDESKYARFVAGYLGTDHREKIFDSKNVFDLIPSLPLILDEPMADASILPTYLLSRFTKKYVKVALGGDGGDELFMGYGTYQAHKAASIYKMIPGDIRESVIKKLVNLFPVSFNNFSFDFKLKSFVDKFEDDPVMRNRRWLGSFSNKNKADLSISPVDYPKKNNKLSEEENIIFDNLTGYLADDILVKTDRASMFASLETRAPFLDHELANFINSIPVNYKLRGYTTKYILKKLMEKRLPKEIVYRKKKGFGIPLSKWLLNDLKPLVDEYLGEERLKKENVFNSDYVRSIITRHYLKKNDFRKEIWTLLVFQMWKEKWKAEI